MDKAECAGPPNMRVELEEGKSYLWWGEEFRESVSNGEEIAGDTVWSPYNGLTVGLNIASGPPFMDPMREADLRALVSVALRLLNTIDALPAKFRDAQVVTSNG